MMAMQEIELVVLVDSNGDYGVGKDADSAKEQYENDIQPVADCSGFRLFNVKLTVPLPEEVELTGEVPADAASAQLSVVPSEEAKS